MSKFTALMPHLSSNRTANVQSLLLRLLLCRVVQNVQYLHEENPTTHILIVGLLPRGSWQDPKDMFKLPSAFSRSISAVNDALERYAFRTKKMHYADCTKPFVQTGNVRRLQLA